MNSETSVLLCRPEGSLNIGAVCRAMATMGFSKLKIVTPAAPINTDEVKKWALKAYTIFEQAQFFDTLTSAIANTSYVVGLSRRQGKRRKFNFLYPNELAKKLNLTQPSTTLVFGNEQSGLSDIELSHCHELVTIPSDDNYPSLNLSHAVQVVLYALKQETSEKTKKHQPISAERLEALSLYACECLAKRHFFTIGGKQSYNEFKNFWYALLGRSGIVGKEEQYLHKFFTKVAHIKEEHYEAKEQAGQFAKAE
jgi:tRNA/rRNA methyltransferase